MAKLLIFISAFVALAAIAAAEKNMVCYFASWTIYRQEKGKFAAADVDPNLCTHILYAFVGLRAEDGSVAVLDDWEITGLKEIEHLMSLKNINPNLKVLVSMGGWNEGSLKYSDVAKNPALRANNIKSILEFIKEYGFDGFDLDWEYPAQRGGDEEVDKANFVTWLGELKAALNAEGYILSAAVSGGINSMDISYNIPEVSNNLDMINVMAYDYHGAFENFVGHYAPLYPSPLDQTEEQRGLNVASGIQHWLDMGADPAKINLGVGTYGRGFSLADPNNSSLYAGAWGGSEGGPYTNSMGMMGYNELCEYHSDWEYIWDEDQQVPHRLHGNQWIGYDDERSIKAKVEFAKSKNLAGLMVWSLDTDDFRGTCGPKYPLLTAMNEIRKN